MSTQFIVNENGVKTAVVISIEEYENLMHQQHITLELTPEYKQMIDQMLEQEKNNQAEYVTLDAIKKRFLPHE
jgi:PHD/YefM family antitoxin component YafN of YafNO toxin-antitoxin module